MDSFIIKMKCLLQYGKVRKQSITGSNHLRSATTAFSPPNLAKI